MKKDNRREKEREKGDLFRRYMWLSEKYCEVNKALSAVRDSIDKAYKDDPDGKKMLFLINDLNLFLLQVTAFDGFVTACLHRKRVGKQGKSGSIKSRVRLLVGKRKAELKYQTLETALSEIEKIRDAWVHGQGNPSILKNPNWPKHLENRFGIYAEEGRMWIRLSHSWNGRTVWSYLIGTLHGMAKLIWESGKGTN